MHRVTARERGVLPGPESKVRPCYTFASHGTPRSWSCDPRILAVARFNFRPLDAVLWRCCSMAIMSTEVDPLGVMPRAILNAHDFRDARVLEVGSGDGRLTFQYAAETRSVVGIDTKEPDIRAASQGLGVELRGNVQFLCASATALPFSAEQFGIVLLASSL